MTGFTFAGSVGRRGDELAGPFPVDLGETRVVLDSPVGAATDRRGNVWAVDAGHNRLLVVDRAFERVLGVVGGPGDAPGEFDLPFRLAHHPREAAFYLTDLGNGRVQRLAYEYRDGLPRVTDARPFEAPGPFHPNGVATHAGAAGVRVFVSDEFYHEGDDLRGRVVVFDGDGRVRDSFRSVVAEGAGEEEGAGVPLYWPQGLAADGAGRVYVANTGYGILHDDGAGPMKYGTVVRAAPDGTAAPFAGRASPTLGDVPMPRDVATVGVGGESAAAGEIVVPDAATGRAYVFNGAGVAEGTLPAATDDDPSPYARREECVAVDRDPSAANWRFRGAVAVAPFRVPAVDDDHGDDPTPGALVAESLAHTVSAYALDVDRRAAERLASVGSPRDAPGRLAFPAGSALLDGRDDAGRAEGTAGDLAAWVADAGNGRVQRAPDLDPAADRATGPGLAPVALPASRFPFGVAVWPGNERGTRAGGDGERAPGGTAAGDRVFVSDYSVAYRDADDGGQIHVYERRPAERSGGGSGDSTGTGAGVELAHVTSFAPWGIGDGEAKLPRGMAVAPLDGDRARVYVADSGNARVGLWTYDRARDAVAFEGDRGGFGHFEGGFWNPADVAVGRRGVYVADENNNRVQRYADGDWTAFGRPGYDRASDDFLLPISVAAAGGYLFVVDLVTRTIKAFEEPPAGADPADGLPFVDAVRAFGGRPGEGELWLPYMLAVTERGGADGDRAFDLLLPDGSLNVAARYRWRPPGRPS
ncbi:MAG: hypothetical protein ABEJ40_03880 [Haloarculaceae archaeon]